MLEFVSPVRHRKRGPTGTRRILGRVPPPKKFSKRLDKGRESIYI
jgi:hypothetical protein